MTLFFLVINHFNYQTRELTFPCNWPPGFFRKPRITMKCFKVRPITESMRFFNTEYRLTAQGTNTCLFRSCPSPLRTLYCVNQSLFKNSKKQFIKTKSESPTGKGAFSVRWGNHTAMPCGWCVARLFASAGHGGNGKGASPQVSRCSIHEGVRLDMEEKIPEAVTCPQASKNTRTGWILEGLKRWLVGGSLSQKTREVLWTAKGQWKPWHIAKHPKGKVSIVCALKRQLTCTQVLPWCGMCFCIGLLEWMPIYLGQRHWNPWNFTFLRASGTHHFLNLKD